jgi:murein L,D-transpeptidase YcbB/YkuD
MQSDLLPRRISLRLCLALFLLGGPAPLAAAPAASPDPAFVQAVAESAADDEVIAKFYRDTGFQAIWTDADDAARRAAFLSALTHATAHGLPVARYDGPALADALRAAASERARGQAEVRLTRAFLAYARDVQSGALVPAKIDPGIVRDIPRRDPRETLDSFLAGDPVAVLRALPPQSPEYAMLLAEKMRLEAVIAAGGWGPALAGTALEPGRSGPAVVALRDRLVAMGVLRPTASAEYDAALGRAIEEVQFLHGLPVDGVAGTETIEALNVSPEARLQSVVVAMERERWLNFDRGSRYVWVNLTDFSARIVDHGKITFQTRSVIGKNVPDQRTPEFSDEMEYMVVNPSWNVPRSITTKEYLPLLKANPNAAGHLKIVDRSGRVVSRASINFNNYTARTFPFSMRQPPSDGNALGKVKFMFPNTYNIYLHDTPQKQLFQQQVRAYSHGCIRLSEPFDFAHALLEVQSPDPVAEFQRVLDTGTETAIRLDAPVPVHLVYFTAYPTAKGQMTYRRDIYGRDARLFEALTEAGVVLERVQG